VHLSGLVWSALLTPDCPACACRDADGRLHINGPLCISVTYLCRVRPAPGPGWFWEVCLYQRLVRSAVERWACGVLHEHACTFCTTIPHYWWASMPNNKNIGNT